jgi:hypothetical protein
VILALVPIHILANFWYGLAKKEPLITAMVTGRKPAADYLDAPEATLVARPMLRAIACPRGGGAAWCLGCVWGAGRKISLRTWAPKSGRC